MAQALGVRLLDEAGDEIGRGGGALGRLACIDMTRRDPRFARIRIDVAVNWQNALLGPRGVARVFGPQKGATPAQVAELERGLETFASTVRRDLGVELDGMKGAGASGGLGAGLHAFEGATLHPRYEVVSRYVDLDGLLARADLVITAEGSLDGQSAHGKAPAEIGRRARRLGVPIVALAGTIGQGAASTLSTGVGAHFSILNQPCSLEAAIADTERLLRGSTEQVVRLFALGRGRRAFRGAAAA
ncbi:glycerate kinase [Hansschlegelia zhihuaiae]|uniref:Glycerate kinase n=2 Tax=Hansschlegelia zhihuaiae TaxID=405005 RepID=A0A4Q0MJI9_9HYPH|nr:glycerate kinase [Hansschlegelia zhihuaiae]